MKVLFLLLAIFVVCVSLHEIASYDIWMHLKSGELMMENKEILKEDLFSYTISGSEWINHQWLSQIIFYKIYDLWNINGLILFKVLLIFLTFLILFLMCWKKVEYFFLCFILFFSLLGMKETFQVRPHLFSFLFFAIFLFIIRRRKHLFLLPVAQVFWVNLHPGFLFGLLVLIFNLSFLPVGLVSFLNPFGVKIFSLVSQQLSSGVFMTDIVEWVSPLGFPKLPISAIISFLIVGIVTLISFLRGNIRRLCVFLIFLILALKSRRNVPFFLMVCIYNCSINFEGFRFAISDTLRRKIVVGLAVCFVMWIGFIGTNLYYRTVGAPYRFGFGVSKVMFPQKGVDFIKEKGIKGNLFNNYDIGGYLIWQDVKVFIDGRNLNYGEEFYTYYKRALQDEKAWNDLANRFNIRTILLSRVSVETEFLEYMLKERRDWKKVYEDDISVVFVR